MFKKALSLLLSMMLVVTSLVATVVSVSAAGDSYFVSGSEELTGYKWAETEATCGDNVMTENGDGNYEKVFTNVAVGSGLIRCSGNIVPFENTFPKNTDLYKLMTTKPGES